MICLACGSDNPYGQDTCWGCAEIFETPPPHARPDHVSQVRGAVAAFREGRLEAAEVGRRWRRFLDRAGAFESRWGMAGGLEARMDPLLRQRFGEPVAEVDGAWADLAAAAAEMDAWGTTGDPAHLEAFEAALEAFFRRACAAVAWLEKELREQRGSSLVDLRSD